MAQASRLCLCSRILHSIKNVEDCLPRVLSLDVLPQCGNGKGQAELD